MATPSAIDLEFIRSTRQLRSGATSHIHCSINISMGCAWVIGFAILLPARANQAVIDQDSKHASSIAWRNLFAMQLLRVKGGLVVHAEGCMGEGNHVSYMQLFRCLVHTAISVLFLCVK